MTKGSPRAARWASVTSAASALEIEAPGCPPYGARRWALSDQRGRWSGFSEACPSAGVPPMGTARSTPSVERTNGWRSGRFSGL